MTLASGCNRRTPSPGPEATPTGADAGAGMGRPLAAPEPTPGVRFRLSDADAAGPSQGAAVPVADGETLAEGDVAALTARLPALPPEESAQVAFALRPGPRPPRTTGDTVRQPFPPPATAAPPPGAEAGALEVSRFQPEGDVATFPRLSITFNQPMVPLTSHGALAAAAVPVTLEPEPPGEWRWAGSRTLIFEPEGGRFPMATTYRAGVPAGTRSATGGALAEDVAWTFRTPPPSVVDFAPGARAGDEADGPTDRQPVVFVAFDQAVDPGAVLAHVVARSDGADVPLRLATPAEVEADESARARAEDAIDGRWLAFRPSDPLPVGAEVTVAVGPGVPSAEGPRVSEAVESFGFEVYGPLEVTELQCGGRRDTPFDRLRGRDRIGDCEPLLTWIVNFNNDLDLDAFEPATVSIEPELAGARVEASDNEIFIHGASKGRTEYRVTLPAALRDEFGQTLGVDTTVTFSTGDMRPALHVPGNETVVLDPAAGTTFETFSINNDRLNVRLHRVEAGDWFAYVDALRRQYEENPPPPPGEVAWSGSVEPDDRRDEIVSVPIDLAPALSDGAGHVVVVVEPGAWSLDDENYANRPRWMWVQATRLGLSSFTDGEAVHAWVTSLADGRPVAGASVRREPADGTAGATTGADGLAAIPLPEAREDGDALPVILVAEDGSDVALLPVGYGVRRYAPGVQLAWFTFADRGLYKPGEEVHFKGFVRRYDPGKGGDVAALAGGPTDVDYVLTASNGDEITRGALAVSTSGGFDGALTIPADVELGYAQLALTARGGDMPEPGREHGMSVNIAEFRRPEFEVKASSEAPYYFIGDQGVAAVEASYYAGGPLPNAETTWWVYANPTDFTPPGRDDFYFGRRRPIWWQGWGAGSFDGAGGEPQDHAGRTDATGTHRLAIDFDGVYPLSAVSFNAAATVMDVNRQAWAGAATFLVHPARDYVGLRTDRWFVETGEAVALEAIVADIDGALVEGRAIAVTAEKVDTTWRNGEAVEETTPAGGCELTSAGEPVSCDLSFDLGGMYRVAAMVADAEGRPNRTEVTVWVAGGPTVPRRGVEQEQVLLVPDRDTYQPGDTAAILVQAPFAPAEGIVSIRRSGLVRAESIRLDEPSTTIRVPVDATLMPNFTVQVDLNGAAERLGADGEPDPDLPKRPAYATGSLDLKVPPLERTLVVDAAPRDGAVEPGGATTVDVTVTDADGSPVAGAEVALVVVDEAVLALDGYAIPDPVEAFYPPRGADVGDRHGRAYVMLADPAAIAEATAGGDERAEAFRLGYPSGSIAEMAMDVEAGVPMAAAPTLDAAARASGVGGGAPDTSIVAERTDFNPLAAFVPAAATGADGRVALEVTVPDNVTRYRVTAVATDGATRFGKGEGTLTARLPIVARPSAPRFLNFGDVFELPVVVQNQTDADATVDVVVRAANIALTDGFAAGEGGLMEAGRRVTVPAGDRLEVRFPAAAEMPGTATFQAGAFAEAGNDAARVSLPVWTPATTEAFATYGTIDDGVVVQPVQRPPDAVEQFGGLELTTSATAVSELSDAFLYLQSYPYEGAEQIASRLIATVALKDVLAAFAAAELPTPAEIDAAVRRDVDLLVASQNGDGGWSWWSFAGRSSPFATVHAAHALARAVEKGYAVPDDTSARAREYLVNIDANMQAVDIDSLEVRRVMRAYALYVRNVQGDRDTGAARALFGETQDHGVEALAWMLAVLSGDPASSIEVVEIRRRLANAATEEAGTAQFTTDYTEEEGAVLLGSNRRADAIVLDAVMTDQPQSDLVPKVVRGLLDHRTNGRWGSTQENGWVLLALERYFRTYEAATPDFVARAWLGDGFVGEQVFRGRTTDRGQTNVPLALVPGGETTDVTLQKDGAGRMYYRLGLRYAPEDLDLEPLERGFSVERTYAAVDDPDDVRRTADGTWEIRAGARVRVKLTLVVPARRYHVALVDPLPAGLEAVNPALETSGTVPPDPDDEDDGGDPWPWWRWWRWYDHSAFRDERVEVFSNLVWDGVYSFDYVARATTPGTFVAPPAKAEELYHPETFGRGASDRVVVVP